jgi:hypothetical protein
MPASGQSALRPQAVVVVAVGGVMATGDIAVVVGHRIAVIHGGAVRSGMYKTGHVESL